MKPQNLAFRSERFSRFKIWPVIWVENNDTGSYLRPAWPHEIVYSWLVRWEAKRWAKEVSKGIAEREKAFRDSKSLEDYREWRKQRSKARGTWIEHEQTSNQGGA